MNIHEYQAKNLLKKYGIKVPDGVFSDKVNDLLEKAKSLKTDKFVLFKSSSANEIPDKPAPIIMTSYFSLKSFILYLKKFFFYIVY